MRLIASLVVSVVLLTSCAHPIYYMGDKKIGRLENSWAQFANKNADTYTYVVTVFNPSKRSYQQIRIDPGVKSPPVVVPIGDVRISWRVFKDGRRYSRRSDIFLIGPATSFAPVTIVLKEN